MRILLWHVHGSWTTSFVQGEHDYVVPVTPDRGPDGRGRARTWTWPRRVRERAPARLRDESFDLVLLQRPHELPLARHWLGRRPGVDLPAVYVEHNTPGGDVLGARHPLADQSAIPIVHVTYFNRLFWDNGAAPAHVIEHGVVDPGHWYLGDLERAGVVINDPVRRGRAVGVDLLPALAASTPLDVFGMNVQGLAGGLGVPAARMRAYQDLPQQRMHRELARRRVYVHTSRWTSLGLSLLEAMHLGMPVVALATTEAVMAVPPDAGVISTRPEELADAAWGFTHDESRARRMGFAARQAALRRYGLGRFLADWDSFLATFAGERTRAQAGIHPGETSEVMTVTHADGPNGESSRLPPRTGAEQPWDPEDLAAAEGRDPTKQNIERARRELQEDGPAAIERTVP